MVKEELEIDEPDVDERGDALSFDALVVQLFEFMLTLAGSSRYRPLVTPALDQLLYLSLGARTFIPSILPHRTASCKSAVGWEMHIFDRKKRMRAPGHLNNEEQYSSLGMVAGYMQMTTAQTEAWEADANQYIADEEEDIFTVRVSADMLLKELLATCGVPTAAALASALQHRLTEASSLKVQCRAILRNMQLVCLLPLIQEPDMELY